MYCCSEDTYFTRISHSLRFCKLIGFDAELLLQANCTTGRLCHIVITNPCWTDDHTTDIKSYKAQNYFYCIPSIYLNINLWHGVVCPKLYFHIAQHLAYEFLYSVTYNVGIERTSIMNRFDPKLNSPTIFQRRFSITDFTELH
jgi:hypothetical protein